MLDWYWTYFWKHYMYYKKATKFGRQNFGYQIWFCTRLFRPEPARWQCAGSAGGFLILPTHGRFMNNRYTVSCRWCSKTDATAALNQCLLTLLTSSGIFVIIPSATKLRGVYWEYTGFTLFVRPSAVGVWMITRILFIGFQFSSAYHITRVKIMDGIDTFHIFSLIMYEYHMLMSVWCPDHNFNSFHWISMTFGIYVICMKILDGIEYQHQTSLNMRIMSDHVTWAFLAFLKSIFQLEPSNSMLRDLRSIHDRSSGFCRIPICVFFSEFFTHLPSYTPMTVWYLYYN